MVKISLSRFDTNKTIIILTKRTLSTGKDLQTVIEQHHDTPKNLTKASDILPIIGDNDMVQHISPINK